MKRGILAWIVVLLLPYLATAVHALDDLAAGDAAWADRAVDEREGRAAAGPVQAALRAYEFAFAEQPEDLEASWKLLRALHFAGDFASSSPAARLPFFERAREVSSGALAALERRIGAEGDGDELDAESLGARLEASGVSRSDVARLYFWSAIAWAAWSRDVGLIGAVRQGVASRLHRYTRVSIALEPDYEGGGALRLLGRLHAELPRVPWLSGWVDRDRALPLLERALSISPEHPGNPLLLALTILDLAPDRRNEALGLLRDVAGLSPRPAFLVEDLAIRDEALRVLADR